MTIKALPVVRNGHDSMKISDQKWTQSTVNATSNKSSSSSSSSSSTSSQPTPPPPFKSSETEFNRIQSNTNVVSERRQVAGPKGLSGSHNLSFSSFKETLLDWLKVVLVTDLRICRALHHRRVGAPMYWRSDCVYIMIMYQLVGH